MLNTQDHLSTTLAALADPTRRAILARLATNPATVTDLAHPFKMSLPAISRHLKVLTTAGLITQTRQAQFRPCHLDPAPLKQVSHYLDQYRRLWDSRLDRLELYLKSLEHDAKLTNAPRRTRKRRQK